MKNDRNKTNKNGNSQWKQWKQQSYEKQWKPNQYQWNEKASNQWQDKKQAWNTWKPEPEDKSKHQPTKQDPQSSSSSQAPTPIEKPMEPTAAAALGLQEVTANKPPLTLTTIKESTDYIAKWKIHLQHIMDNNQVMTENLQTIDTNGFVCYVTPDTTTIGGDPPSTTIKSHYCWACYTTIDAWNIGTHVETKRHKSYFNDLMERQKGLATKKETNIQDQPAAAMPSTAMPLTAMPPPMSLQAHFTPAQSLGDADIRFAKAAQKPQQLHYKQALQEQEHPKEQTNQPPQAPKPYEQSEQEKTLNQTLKSALSQVESFTEKMKNTAEAIAKAPWRRHQNNEADRDSGEYKDRKRSIERERTKDTARDRKRSRTTSRRRSYSRKKDKKSRSRSRSAKSSRNKDKDKEKKQDKKKDKDKKKKKERKKSSSSSSSSSTSKKAKKKHEKMRKAIREEITLAVNPPLTQIIPQQFLQLLQNAQMQGFRAITDPRKPHRAQQ